jgi:hypothetical protein
MTIDTCGISLGYKTAAEMASLIENALGVVVKVESIRDHYVRLSFPQQARLSFLQHSDSDTRILSVFLNGYCSENYSEIYQGEATYSFLECGGDSVAIMQAILEQTGGYLITDDSDEDNVVFVHPKNDSKSLHLASRMKQATQDIQQAMVSVLAKHGFSEDAKHTVEGLTQNIQETVLAIENARLAKAGQKVEA